MRQTARVRQLVGVGAFLTLALLAAACGNDDADGANASPNGSGDDSLVVVGAANEPTTLDAQLADDTAKDLATWSVNEGLVYFDAEGNLEPILAAELPVIDEEDPLRWRVQLREGISFTNGEPFNAEAVKANIERILDPDYGSELAGEFGSMSGAEVVDEYTVDVLTDAPDPILDHRLTFLRVVPPEAASEADYGENPVGTGPYVFQEWNKGRNVVLSANPDYWGGAPEVDEVEIRFIPDAGTRLSALQAGEIQLAANIAPDRADDVPQMIVSNTVVKNGIVRINLEEPPYDQADFRRALNYAVNKQALNENLFGGEFELSQCQMVGPESAGFNEDLEPYPYDPERARELISQVDLPEDFEVVLDVHSPGTNLRETEIVQSIVADWQDVGLNARVQPNENDVWLDKLLAAGEGSTGGNPNAPALFYLESDNALNHALRHIGIYYGRDGEVSTTGTKYPEIDEMIESAETLLDDEERQEAIEAVTDLTCEEAFFVYVLARKDVWGAAEDISYTPGFGVILRFDFGRLSIS